MLVGKENLQLLGSPKKICITTHHKPDGDALGSSLALYHWLEQKGHQVQVVISSDYPSFLNWMPGAEDIVCFPHQEEKAIEILEQSDIIFCLDYSVLARADVLAPFIIPSSASKWMIDHHTEPEDFASLTYWDASAAATAQLVYKFLVEELHAGGDIDENISSCLYTGIMTDTGSFRFRNTSSEVHRIVASLIDRGARNSEIHDLVYSNSSETRLKFLGYTLLNCLHVIPEYSSAYFKISKEDLGKFNTNTGDTEGLVNYALSLEGIRMAAIFIDRTEVIKLSLRSVGDIPVNEICRIYFNGGGHINASGGVSTKSLDEVESDFLQLLPIYKSILNK